jgi:hypothetical protein
LGVPPRLLFPFALLSLNRSDVDATRSPGGVIPATTFVRRSGAKAVGRGRLAWRGKAGWGWLSVRGMREGLGYPQTVLPIPNFALDMVVVVVVMLIHGLQT